MTQELSPNKQPIAVVGVSALFPGSTDATGFWRDILAGRDLIRDVPESHWLVEDFYDADPSAPDKTYARRGAFLDPIDFDALGWGVPPSTIPATDTSQLLALVLAQRVLQDAARGQFETMDRSRISVILGVTSAQELLSSMVSRLQRPVWVKALRESGLPETEVQAACDRISASYVPWQESTFPGLLGNVVAGRIANRLNLGGTNCVTDAACASTFSALAMGVSELQLGNSDLVISGGVDTLNDIFMFMCFSKTPALSPTGDCRPFSDQADGTMLGEGLGMVALKRLADAERDGDRIYAVVRGVGTSSDGRSKSVYAPVPAGQAQALRRTYALAGYGPETVELLEAHGTGTKAGDAAEFEGLRMVFDEASDTRQWCALGSVKSQIGHTKAAAGAAGLFKAVMALHHKVLPPSIKIDAPNPKLRLEESPFYLSTKTRPWIRDGQHPRRASVSAFGFGGSNFHVALEEYQGPAPKAERLYTGSRELVAICGENGAEVARRARELVNGGSSLGVAARASQKAYVAGAAARLAVVASDRTELDAKLLAAAKRIESKPGEPFTLPDGTAYGAGPESGKLAFLFPGQGSQYVGMGAELAIHFGAGRGPWDRAADLSLEPGTPLHEVVFPRPGFGAAKERADEDRLTATEWAQPAIGCVSLSQLALLHGIGIRPEMVAGHSFGEVVALHAAGVVDECDLLRVARRRGELMAEAASIPGGMTSLSLPVERVRELVARLEPRVVVANHNGPAQVVVSGPADALAAFEAKLLREGIAAKRLPVATAFHSSVVASSCAPFADFLSGISFEPARLPVYSNALAAPYENDAEVLRAGLASQIASPVRFVEMVEAMYAAGARTFVEVGPGSVLTSLVDAILGEKPHLAVNLDRKGKDGVESLLLALARLVAAGAPMKLDRLFAEYRESVDVSAAGKLAVPISGSNYGKIYPPPGGAKALPLPNPPRPVAPAAPPKEAVKPAERPVAAPAPVESPVIASPVPAVPAPPPASSVWVNAFQESQRQTADAHAAFQRAMFESHTAFLSVAESAFQGLTALVSGAPFAASRETERTAVAPPVQAVVVSPVVAAPPARPVAETLRPAPEAQPPAPALAPVFQPVAPVLVPVASASPAVDLRSSSFQGSASPAAPARSLGSSTDLQALMLTVVAEKTGYPTDMLNLDMDLEGDLGIDSIKRVEILAAVDERAPELPKVDMSHMGGLQTLRQIVDYMQSLATPTVAPARPPTVPATFSAPAPAPAGSSIPTGALPVAAASTVDLKALMLAVVAEKTGYPTDMLNLDMDLEGDLGIDSIKRVEILAAVDERAPELPKVDMSHMGGLQTLRQIVDYMQGLATSTVAPAQPSTVPAPFSAPAPAGSSIPTGTLPVAAASTVDLKALMLAVVAEKTGYPMDMLNLDMDLEGDLGIDSIKRVEILAAVDERAPELPKVDMSHMGGLQTLRQIVDYMQGLATPTFAPAQPPTVPAPFSAPAPAGSSIPTGALPVAAASTVDLKALMLTVVAEKTGYPMDMLNLDMDLEGDLGIDSIKRVEILAAVDERAPELPNVDMSHMGGLQTLRQIVQYMQDLATPTFTSVPLPAVPTTVTVSAPVPAPVTVRAHVPAHAPAQLFVNAHLPTPVASHPSPLGRFRLELIAAPTTGLAQPGLLGGGEVWITGGGELDAALAAELSRRGVNARAAGAVPAGATACVYLGGLRAVASDDEALSVNREAFDVARILARRLETSRGLFVTVQDTGGAFGLAEMEARRAWLSGLPALVKTAAQEWPQASLKAIDLERAGRDAPSIAVAVADELLRGGGEIEVALPASGGRFTLRSVPGPVEPGEAVIGRGEVVVVSGGARGVTAACVAEWARDCHARFVLLGRTPLQDDPASCLGVVDESGLKAALLAEARSAGQSPKPSELLARVRGVQGNREIRQTLAAVEAAGGRARYEAVSVTDVQALAFTLARVRAEWGPVVGVVHAAGVLADKKISEKTDEAFDRVFDTKVEGLRALLSATAADPLKLLCVFSSVSARCGNNGQSDYAMANEILAKVALAESRRRPGVLVKSLGWGPWEGGMVTPQLRGRFAALGVPMIPLAVGARMMADELTGANCQDVELVLGGEPKAEALLFAGAEARVQELELRVQRGSHGYLEGHAVNGMPVVPVVLAAEWLSRAARCFRPGLSLAALHDFKVLKGIRLGGFDNGGDRFVIQATQLPSARGAQLQLVVRDSHGALHYSARAELLPEPRTPDAGLPALSLEAWAGEPLYKDLLFHRGKFELIEQMDGISDHGVGATLRGVHHAGWNGGEPWQLDVAALDGGLQMAVLFGQRMLGGPNLPTSIDEVRSYGVSPGKGLITAAAYGRKVGSAAVTTDILFTDDQGRRLAALLGVQNHVLPRA